MGLAGVAEHLRHARALAWVLWVWPSTCATPGLLWVWAEHLRHARALAWV